ncbi:MarR family transcriptional regulator [Priestia megaterium]|uniref:MarR family transcriptional regulator n=1 Tax=Priestia megaterium TaxID=1404 RepID=UPI001155903A|nr:helix-turn-helix domain-containing protein [Priestia megaterium]
MSNKDVQMELVMYSDDRESIHRIVVNDPEKYNITNKAQAEAYAKKMELENQRIKDTRGNFVISKNEPMKELETSGITIADRRYLMQLILYVQFNGEPLSKNGEPLDAHDIAELWNLDYKVANKRISKFTKLGIIESVRNPNNKRTKNYFLNEQYFLMGKVKSGEKFVKLFQKKLAEIIENIQEIERKANRRKDKPVEIVDVIGLLNAVMPYFHYQTYYLVKNPDDNILIGDESVNEALERDPSQLKHLTRTQIGRILGHKKARLTTIDKYMEYLEIAGAVMITRTKSKSRYLIHPDLMFRSDGIGMDDYTRTIRNQFNQHN